MTDAQVMDLDAVVRSELPMFRTDLDSHANMVAVGRNVQMASDTGSTAKVRPFTPDFESTHQFPIVDDAITCDDENTGHECMITVTYSLSVPAMDRHLIPPFAIRESGIDMSIVAKFQIEVSSIEGHSVCFREENLRKPLKFYGVFSCFPSMKPSIDALKEIE